MRIHVVLGGHLRTEAEAGLHKRTLDLPSDATIADVVRLVELPPERVGMIMLNGRGAKPSSQLSEDDRVGLFPPELRYNTFVSLYFRTDETE